MPKTPVMMLHGIPVRLRKKGKPRPIQARTYHGPTRERDALACIKALTSMGYDALRAEAQTGDSVTVLWF